MAATITPMTRKTKNQVPESGKCATDAEMNCPACGDPKMAQV
jgi:hypothetical protein